MINRLVVCDLEATCWDDKPFSVDEMDIIEIGCVLVTLEGEVLDTFSTFVKPTRYPVLSAFCQTLTSIKQSDVDKAPSFSGAMALLDSWAPKDECPWASWGNYDRKQFSTQAQREMLPSLFLQTPHINLKKAWRLSTRHKHTALQSALSFHNLQFQGVQHRGIDDAINTARLLPYIDNQILTKQLEAS